MSRRKRDPNLSGWVQVIVGLTVVVMATAGVGHDIATNPRPPTVCAQLRVLARAS